MYRNSKMEESKSTKQIKVPKKISSIGCWITIFTYYGYLHQSFLCLKKLN